MNKDKLFAAIIFVVFFVASVFLWLYSDAIVAWSATTNPLLAIPVYFLSQPPYVGFILLLAVAASRSGRSALQQAGKARAILAGFLMTLAFDIVSLPHLIPMAGGCVSGAASFFTDSLIQKFLGCQMPTFIVYVLIPAFLMLGALFVLMPKAFKTMVQEEFRVRG